MSGKRTTYGNSCWLVFNGVKWPVRSIENPEILWRSVHSILEAAFKMKICFNFEFMFLGDLRRDSQSTAMLAALWGGTWEEWSYFSCFCWTKMKVNHAGFKILGKKLVLSFMRRNMHSNHICQTPRICALRSNTQCKHNFCLFARKLQGPLRYLPFWERETWMRVPNYMWIHQIIAETSLWTTNGNGHHEELYKMWCHSIIQIQDDWTLWPAGGSNPWLISSHIDHRRLHHIESNSYHDGLCNIGK